MDADRIDAYLDRIGARRPERLDADSLRELQERHLSTVPFENLSIHIGERITLTEDALFDKIVRRKRGGFCYELNGAFAALLAGLGFDVTLLAVKVFIDGGKTGPPFDHLALRVDLDEPWLADVGFGRHARRPLRLTGTEPQHDVEGEFLVLPAAAGDWEIRWNGKAACLVEARARELSDFIPTCWWQATSPDSHFTGFVTCSLPTPVGRITLGGDRLYETIDGERTETVLPDEDAIMATYRDRFGFEPDRLPSILHPRT
ncbi:MAG: arylamine N-acetyltransferase [Actinophytocola sp.]|nr:arylamine N-acetyltransferase [Actinophytocola sp.]